MLANAYPAWLNSRTLSAMCSDLSPPVHAPPWTQTTRGRPRQPLASAAGRYTSRLVWLASTPGCSAYRSVRLVPHATVGLVSTVVLSLSVDVARPAHAVSASASTTARAQRFTGAAS